MSVHTAAGWRFDFRKLDNDGLRASSSHVYTRGARRQRKMKDGIKYKKEKGEENMSASLKARQRPFYTGVVHEAE